MLKQRNNKLIQTAVLLSVLFQLLSTPVHSKSHVIIKQLNKSGCYKQGEFIQVLGKGFGKASDNTKLVLQGNRDRIIVKQIKQWTAVKITAQLPKKFSAAKSNSYILGILENNRWISNRDIKLELCKTIPDIKSSINKSSPPIRNQYHQVIDPGLQLIDTSNLPSVLSEDSNTNKGNPFYQRSISDQSSNLTGLVLPTKMTLDSTKKEINSEISEPHEIVIVTTTLEEAMGVAQFVQQYDIRIKRRSNFQNLQIVTTILTIPENYSIHNLVTQLREHFPQFSVDLNHRYQLLNSGQTGADRAKYWAYDRLGWSNQQRRCKPKLALGIIDTGIAPTALIKQDNIKHKSLLSNGVKAATMDHATAIVSFILGAPEKKIPGLLPKARIFSASIFRQRTENEIDTTTELIIKALNWMLEQKADVINLSLGGPHNYILEQAIHRTLEQGVIIVSAAGIDSQGKSLYPAAQEGVIAVTAIDANLQPHSSKTVGDFIDFSAPGVDLWLLNQNGEGRFLSGSSFAAPVIAASYLLLNKTPNQIDLLKNTVRDLGEPGKDDLYGWGLALVHRACITND